MVGAGIVGLATAEALARAHPDATIAVLEKEDGAARHQTGHNSGVIHSGVYYRPGSLKALTCRRGYGLMVDFLRAEGLAHELCGKVIVASEPGEVPRLEEIYRRGVANGLRGLEFLDDRQLREREPYAAAVRALYVPQSGIADYGAVSERLVARLRGRGVDFHFGARAEAVTAREATALVRTTAGDTFEGGHLVSCAGLYSDRLARSSGLPIDYRIIPFRGEYYDLVPGARHLVRGLIYPVPDPAFPFLGVHFTKTVHGGVESGPNAVFAFRREGYRKTDVHLRELTESLSYRGFLRLAARHRAEGAREMYRSLSPRAYLRSLQKLVPSIRARDVVPGGAGVRAQAVRADGTMVDDFLILRTGAVTHVCNAPSPAATASLAIGERIAAEATGATFAP